MYVCMYVCMYSDYGVTELLHNGCTVHKSGIQSLVFNFLQHVCVAIYNIGITEGGAAMSDACKKGEVAVVKELIEKGANVNLKDEVRNFEQSQDLFSNYLSIVKIL